ncbi:hypothetical protein [Gandjariella thermophila]|uniref:Glycosyl hydrolase family 43 n=1 Tax=Gandjariella thermophila TaxID=1931992 RepID=A0A4D4JCU5_9PSEU|nr:hypothetical protein [Gandjariella thermophila]GDY33454.1 hypothetical protein GTS_50870 [Gandjariella thermophila]
MKARLAALGLALSIIAGLILSGSSAAAAPTAFNISGIDLHDGMIVESGGTYYLYGTEYGCGFQWGQANTPWCGFGVSTATSPSGPWSTPTLLFDPNAIDPWTNTTWVSECGSTGAGCFNPRMIQRSGWGANDGVWILWFNAPADYNRNRANAYYALGCNGPAGPCGYTAPYGSVHKPNLWVCSGNGDFSIVPNGSAPPVMLCTMPDQTLAEEQLDTWGTNGTGTGSTNLAGLTNTESPGAYQDPGTGTWIMTYSDPNCGYCQGAGTGYATATNLLGPWTAPTNTGWSAPATGRRDLSATSCGGQPRTVITLDGQPYQTIDLWTGSANETTAGLHYEPLTYQHPAGGSGTLWQPFTPWTCG